MAASTAASKDPGDIGDQTFIRAVESVCSVEVARKISHHYGGCSLYIPSKPRPHHALAELVGMDPN